MEVREGGVAGSAGPGPGWSEGSAGGGEVGGVGRLWEARCGEGRGPPGVEERGPDEANAGEMPKRSAAPRAEHLPQREAGGGAGPGEGGRREDLAG